MKAEIRAGLIYLAIAGGIGWLWVTGAGATGIAAIQSALAGQADPTLRARLSLGPRRKTTSSGPIGPGSIATGPGRVGGIA
jgi:hypothetical protein